MTNQLFLWEFCVVHLGTYYHHQNYEQLFLTNNRVFVLLVGWSVRDGQNTTYLQLDQNWNVSTSIWQNILFYQHSNELYDVMQKKIPKYQAEQNPTYQTDSLKKEINEKLLAKADSLVDKHLCCPHIKLSNWQTLILDDVETGVWLSDVAEQHRRNNADVTDIHFTLLDAAGMSPTLVLNQNTKTKEIGSWVPFKIWMSEAAEIVHAMPCC